MRLRAIRVSDVGGFKSPVAMEGLSGGLDVLLAPNETGKSTLFRAIEAVFLRKHSARGPFLTRLAPHSGGTPLIEADFEAGGGLWRITKQFGQGKTALLKGLGGEASGSWRNADAESKLFELLGAGDGYPGRFGALWVGQRHGLGEVRLDHDPETGRRRDGGETNALVAAIEQEIAEAAGGSLLAAVRAELMSRATRLLTDTLGRVRTNGPLAQAQEACRTLRAELEAAEAAAARTAERRRRIEAIDRELEDLQAPDVVRARDQRLAALSRRIADAEAAADRLRRLEAEARHAEGLAARAEEQFKRFSDALAEAGRLSAAAADHERRRQQLVARLEEAEEARAAASRQVQESSERLNTLRATFERLERGRLIEGLHRDRARLIETRGRVAELEDRIAALSAVIRDNPVTADLLSRIRAAQSAVEVAESRLDAAAPVIEVNYEPGGGSAILIAGSAVPEGERIAVRAPLELTIPGVGSVTVSPGGGTDLDAAEADLATARNIAADRLSAAGADTIEGAIARAQARANAESALQSAIATLNGLAPDGGREVGVRLAGIDAKLASLGEGTTDDVREPDGTLDPEGLKGEIAAVEEALETARGRERDADRAYHEIGRELDGVQLRRDETLRRQLELDAQLGAAEDRDQVLGHLEETARESGEAANSCRRNVVAMSDSVLDEAAFGALVDERASLEAQAQTARSHIRHLEDERLELVAQVNVADEAGASLRVRELSGELARASHLEEQLTEEADALKLAITAVDEAARRSRDRFSAPVYEALRPYLAPLFADGDLIFGNNFQPQALCRGGRSERFDHLSDGTQEQLGVLVRLAFGRVFADASQSGPIILDDPLAYADTNRLAQVFAALHAASEQHQVIVFSCRTSAFRPLGGHRLELSAWDAESSSHASARRLSA